MRKINVIYLPGLGDNHPNGQDLVLKFWKYLGLNTHYHYIYWSDKGPFEDKLLKILNKIDELSKNRGKIALVSTSAGASAAINAYAKRKENIFCVVCICGKLKNTANIPEMVFKYTPSFKESLKLMNSNLDKLDYGERQKIMAIRPIRDEIVPVEDAYIDGARDYKIPTIGHFISIIYALTLGSFGISKFIKQQALRYNNL
jgi:hypothetical protein